MFAFTHFGSCIRTSSYSRRNFRIFLAFFQDFQFYQLEYRTAKCHKILSDDFSRGNDEKREKYFSKRLSAKKREKKIFLSNFLERYVMRKKIVYAIFQEKTRNKSSHNFSVE